MNKLVCSASASALAIAISTPAIAQDAPNSAQSEERVGGVDTIIVTAQKRSEDLQDVPISVSAIGEEALDELNIDTFEDYLDQLPTVTAGGSGPGQSTIYIRGLASTTPNLSVAGVAGLAPNVALYLNDQPLAQPGRNLDVYAADLERIEVLSGPQGTLFGASSQAGVVRLITNKPSLSGFDASFAAGVSFTKNGETSYKGEAMLNVPVTDTLALRGVVYLDDQGGYIDNVRGTRSARESGRFRPSGTVRSNGVPVNANRGGFQSDAASLAALDTNVTFIRADNTSLVEEDFNDTQYAGFRISGLWEVTPDWTVTLSHQSQSLESDGVFFADPELGGLDGLNIQRFENDTLEDDFSNTSWTVEGRIAMLDVVYTGAYTERTAEQRSDYTDYLFVGQQVGGFYSDLELKERVDFAYPGNVAAAPFGGFAPNFAFPGAFNTDDGAFPAETIFRNDIRRTDEQFGIFGEASFDIVPDLLTVTAGARYYDIKVDLEGGANATFCNTNAAGVDENAFGTNISDLYDGDGQFFFNLTCTDGARQTFTLADSLDDIRTALAPAFGTPAALEAAANRAFNSVRAPDKAKTSGVIYKGTVTLTPTEDLLFYTTYSEGFRPGLLNRPGGALGPNGFTVPFELETDEVKNYEFGWKLDMIDGQLRLNGSAFYVDISNLQTTIFDPSITNLFFSDNAANAEIRGVEADFTIAPYALPGLTVAGAVSFLDTEITEVLTPTNDVIQGEPLAFAPEFQGNLRVRYEWDINDNLEAYLQPQVSHSGSKFTDIIEINKLELDSYTTFDLAYGIKAENWSAEIYGENLTDERAQISGNFGNDVARIVTNRPTTIGLRVKFDY